MTEKKERETFLTRVFSIVPHGEGVSERVVV